MTTWESFTREAVKREMPDWVRGLIDKGSAVLNIKAETKTIQITANKHFCRAIEISKVEVKDWNLELIPWNLQPKPYFRSRPRRRH